MTKEYKTIKTELRLPYELAYGATWTRFFEGMQEKKIYGTKCPKCGKVLVPARSFCPKCFVDTDKWVEVSQEGKLTAWSYTNYRYFGQPVDPPFIGALIRLDGTDVDLLHLVGGIDLKNFDEVKRTIKNGMKVKAVWSDERKGHILDIRYFEPV
ncbi:MAG: Zn-ribbon domain-containing OB-fold protein [Syntrophales bacterium]|nr:Zn-ribbon domain-containing OB-fold protein [Syntrophales bacterium]MDD5531189.1 Zn-ribbon domain-containing OB-fold protein [Syntrophales bacterium]HPL62281.1 Zn-ribbon domain-containing OB-fold protein [Syntrophales bacterium]